MRLVLLIFSTCVLMSPATHADLMTGVRADFMSGSVQAGTAVNFDDSQWVASAEPPDAGLVGRYKGMSQPQEWLWINADFNVRSNLVVGYRIDGYFYYFPTTFRRSLWTIEHGTEMRYRTAGYFRDPWGCWRNVDLVITPQDGDHFSAEVIAPYAIYANCSWRGLFSTLHTFERDASRP